MTCKISANPKAEIILPEPFADRKKRAHRARDTKNNSGTVDGTNLAPAHYIPYTLQIKVFGFLNSQTLALNASELTSRPALAINRTPQTLNPKRPGNIPVCHPNYASSADASGSGNLTMTPFLEGPFFKGF